ncbi:MDR family MFS transporter [Brassicibacter mesophilus]|uniref:MDR family MFS transporter n=1 Tax=Brassicibacter mesophilus TaxID=745119 RepID=UPI003D1F6F09
MTRIKDLLTPYKGLPREVYVIFISRIVNALGCFVMPLLTFILTKNVGLSSEEAGFYMSISGFLYLPASIIGGKLADTIGRKKVIIFFDTIAAILYIICGFMEPSMNMVYVIMLAGASMVAAGPAHDSLIADLTTPENRKGAYSLSYMGWNIGFAIGPLIGGILYKNHLPWIFIGDALTALLSLSLITIFIKETIHKTEEQITDKERVLEKREEGSIISVLLRRPILIYFALITFGFNFVYSQWGFLMPLHSDQNFLSNGAYYYGIMASFNGIVVIFFTPIVTKLGEKAQNIRLMAYGGLLYAIGFGMLGFLNTLLFFFVSVFIFTIGEILLSISTSPFIANHTPASHRGRMSAALPIIFGMGYTLGPWGMGKILTHVTIEHAWIMIGIFGVVSTIFMLNLEKYEKKNSLQHINEDKILEG